MHADANRILPPFHAFGLAIFAYLFFTLSDTLGKWLQAGGYGAAQILVTVNVTGFALMLCVAAVIRGPRAIFKGERWRLHLLRGLLLGGSTMLVLIAIRHLPLADFYGIVFLNPIWVALISRLILKQHIPPSRWLAIGAGFLGVLVIAGPRFADLNVGALAALAASLCSAGAALLARRIGGHEPPTNFSLATHATLVLLNLPVMLFVDGPVMPALPDLGLMVLYGVLLSIAMISISLVFARSHVVSQVAPLQYTQMLWGVLLGWLVFDQPPTARIFAGSLLVMGAGIYILHSLRRGRLMTH
ncbi:MAG: DMT family transporter [Rhodospirillales bacterium]|nr:DMT family transporter [Alphaproteobacteria bacterium]MCB9987047.1 DMT family transporter [Rhodospirillales bacterium]USO08185.1 MAG: DMT family transporter [Rhodospirillales bacterium]